MRNVSFPIWSILISNLSFHLLIVIGGYQIRMAKSYVNEYLTSSSLFPDRKEFIVQVRKDVNDLVCIRFESCHSNSAFYYTYIEYKEQSEQPIQCWYCNCPIGERVIGCCSHVATVLWCLFRHQGDMSAFIQQSNKYFDFIQDALPISDYDDSSEEDYSTYSLEQ